MCVFFVRGGGYSEFFLYESYEIESQRDLKITYVENIISQNQLLFSKKVIININPKYTWVFFILVIFRKESNNMI